MQEFLNTFSKGMSSDLQVVYQPEGTWRYLKNCDVISQDGNNYAIKDCMGNTLLFSLNIPYKDIISELDVPPTPLAFLSFPNRLIVLSTNNEAAGGYLEIGEIKAYPYGEGIQPKYEANQQYSGYTPLYHHKDLNCTLQHKIEGFAFPENELINRIYWTDNYNPPRVFNVTDPIYTSYISSGGLVNGEQYMVLQGAVTYPPMGGTMYGPGLTAGNVFTATPASTFYTASSGTAPTPLVTKYNPYKLLDWTPSRNVAEVTFKEYGAGQVICGDKIYFTRLVTSDESYSTPWSYGTAPIHVGTENSVIVPGTPYYHNFAGGGTTSATLNSGKSVFLTIDNIDTDFGIIEVACAEFDGSPYVARQITGVIRVNITGTSMVVEHTGNESYGSYTIDDLTLFPASILTAKTISTNKNYNLIGNVVERSELNVDFSGVTCTSFEYPMNCHVDPFLCGTGGMNYHGAWPPTLGANPGVGEVVPYSRYYVEFADLGLNKATYMGTDYVTGQVITGVGGAFSGAGTITFTGSAQVRPCVTRNRYTTTLGSRVENAIPLTTGFWTYKDPAVHHHALGYMSGETYRFGLVAFDLRGNPFYARWLADYTFPGIPDKGGIIRSDMSDTNGLTFSLNPSGIKFSGITFTQEVMDQMSGFMIVRAERDAISVTQGLLTQLVSMGTSPNIYKPAAWNSIGFDNNPVGVNEKYAFICPDILVDAPLNNSVGVPGDIIKEACFLSAYAWLPLNKESRVQGGREQIYTKYMLPYSPSSAVRQAKIDAFATVNEGQDLNLPAGIIFRNGDMKVSTTSSPSPDDQCIAGGSFVVNGNKAQGCKKSYVSLETDFLDGTGSGDYSVSSASQKMLVNYQKAGKTIGSLYGGSSPAAKANTLYMSTGHYQPITAQVKADTFNGTNYIFNNVEVFGGDCFLNLVDIGYALWDNSFPSGGTASYSYAWTFPCECQSNYELRRGRKTSNVGMYFTGTASTDSIVYNPPTGSPRLEEYSYNPGYSADNDSTTYPSLPVNYVNASKFVQRIRWAGPKFFGEIVDSFRNFLDFDYKDLSGQNGRINNIKVFKDSVVVWQDLAINTVPILERQVVTSTTNQATILGTGGVIDRFDVINSYFGNQHQWSVVETEYGFAWFDMIRKAFLILDFGGGGLAEVSLVQGMQSFFNEAFVEMWSPVLDPTSLLNSQDLIDSSDRPLVGIGITGVYDPKYKMTYMTFKFKSRRIDSFVEFLHKDFTVGYRYDDREKFFTGFYDWNFCIAHNHNQWVLSVNNPKCTTQYINSLVIFGYSFKVGETVPYTFTVSDRELSGEYICIQDVTIDSLDKLPAGVDGASYWKLVNKTNQIWVSNQPKLLGQTYGSDYSYNMFFGKVVDNEVSLIVNPLMGKEPFFVASIEQTTPTNVNYTDIELEGNAGQQAADLNIRQTDLNYQFSFNRIKSSLPIQFSGARIFSNYLKLTFKKKNYTTDPTVMTGTVKLLQNLKSYFKIRK